MGLDSSKQFITMNALFLTVLVITEFTIPQCKYFIRSFKGRFRQKAESHPSAVAHVSANITAHKQVGLGHRSAIDASIAALVVPSDKAQHSYSYFPSTECRHSDYILVRIYDIALCVGKIFYC